MKAERLPSGNYRVRATYTANGKKHTESFTAPTAEEALYMAAKYKKDKQRLQRCDLTVGEAMDMYINDRNAILSPSTIVSYQKIRRNNLQGLMGIKVQDITQEDIQRAVNVDAKIRAPKTIRCAHGLLCAVLKVYRKDFAVSTVLPRLHQSEMEIPEQDIVTKLINACQSQDIKVAIMLAAMLGLRRSEISALKWDDVDGTTIRVDEAIVLGEDGLVTKAPKSKSGHRKVEAPKALIDEINKLPRKSDLILNMTPNAISSKWQRLKRETGVKCRFHDLRHYYASVMLALGVPDKYAMERMGHATPDMLKRVYQHIMVDKRNEVAKSINSYLEKEHLTQKVTRRAKKSLN